MFVVSMKKYLAEERQLLPELELRNHFNAALLLELVIVRHTAADIYHNETRHDDEDDWAGWESAAAALLDLAGGFGANAECVPATVFSDHLRELWNVELRNRKAKIAKQILNKTSKKWKKAKQEKLRETK